MTKSHFDNLTVKTKNYWRSVDAYFNVLSFRNLLPWMIVFIIVWTDWIPFWLIETRPFGNADPSNIVALVTLILLQFIQLPKWLIPHTILLFINQYPHATAHSTPIIFLWMKFLVKRHNEPCKSTSTHSVWPFLVPLIPPHFDCIYLHHHVSAYFFDPVVDQINSKTFGAALTSCRSRLSGSSMGLFSSI